jgi:hypothetical protein
MSICGSTHNIDLCVRPLAPIFITEQVPSHGVSDTVWSEPWRDLSYTTPIRSWVGITRNFANIYLTVSSE